MVALVRILGSTRGKCSHTDARGPQIREAGADAGPDHFHIGPAHQEDAVVGLVVGIEDSVVNSLDLERHELEVF